ncbi:MAG: type II secretion system protein GspG [Candidatus Omnitrophica bacterium]|nr:type II secretion system protein GspG [Candidatus Omnitrophota bacterium]
MIITSPLIKIPAVRTKGLTLLEIMAVITVVGILIVIAIPRINGMRDEANIIKAKEELDTIKAALQSYYINHRAFPSSSPAITADVLTSAVPQIVDHVFYDPFGATPTSEYQYTASDDGQYYAVYSLGLGRTGLPGIVASNGSVTLPGDAIVLSNGELVGKTGDDNGCDAGQTKCSENCVNTTSDVSNCGACEISCYEGQTCNSGNCTPGALGQRCSSGSDCDSQYCNNSRCGTGANSSPCNSNDDCQKFCGSNMLCGGQTSVDPCSSNDDCQDGYCSQNGCSDGSILSPCISGAQCKSTYCNVINNECSNGESGKDLCISGAECKSHYCNTNRDICSEGNDGDECNSPEDCKSGVCSGNLCIDEVGIKNCMNPSECRSNYCNNLTNLCSNGNTNDGCWSGADCQSTRCVNNLCAE